MRRLVEQSRDRIAQFIVQRDDLVLVVRCSDADAAVVSMIATSLDESSTSELFWIVVDEFQDDASFVEACVRAFDIKHQAANGLLQRAKKPPLPPLPASLANANQLPPLERLKQLIVFSRSLLPTLEGCGVVWGLLPMKVANVPAYVALMTALWRHELPFPWCHHVRLIIRDTFPESTFLQRLARAPRVRSIAVDLSPDAIQQALEEDAGSDQVPLAERVNCSLILAGIDYSHGRHDRAIQQYELVHRYAAATSDATLAAIALNGMGEVQRTLGKLDLAGDFFHAAMAPAAQAPGPPVPVLLNLYLNLGELRHSQQRWQEAEGYLQGAAGFAFLMHDPGLRLRCWNLLGEAQSGQGKVELALRTWMDGAIVAGRLQRDDDYQVFIQQLRAHFARKNDEKGMAAALRRIRDAVSAQDENARSPATHPVAPRG